MSDAPERIVLLPRETLGMDRKLNDYIASQPNAVEYVRSDQYATLEAEVSRLTALLNEAKGMARPFARIAEAEDFSGTPDGKSIIVNVNLCRAARSFAEKAGA